MSIDSNPEEAARLFLNMLVTRAYDGVIEDMTSLLEKGPPGRKPPQGRVILHQWFLSLDDENRKNVLKIIREAVDSAIFGCLVLLDGMWGGYPIEGQRSDFAVYLQVYEDANKMEANLPETRVRLNSPAISNDLHDMFRLVLQERMKREE